MPLSKRFPLAVATRVLRWLTVLNLVYGAMITALLIFSLVNPIWTYEAIGVPAADINAPLKNALQLLCMVGIAGVPFAHFCLTGLKAIVATVAEGDPFVAENAGRLRQIGRGLLGLQILELVAGALIASIENLSPAIRIDWNISVAGWIAVLCLFILAQVFETGAAMRKDLEGTV